MMGEGRHVPKMEHEGHIPERQLNCIPWVRSWGPQQLLRKQELLKHWFPLPKSLWKTVPLLLSCKAESFCHFCFVTWKLKTCPIIYYAHIECDGRKLLMLITSWAGTEKEVDGKPEMQTSCRSPQNCLSCCLPPSLRQYSLIYIFFRWRPSAFFHIWTARKHTSTTLPSWDALLLPPLLLRAHRGSMCNSRHEGVLFWVSTHYSNKHTR